MPQLDFLSFFSQILFLSVVFFISASLFNEFVLGLVILSNLRFRLKKKMSSLFTLKDC